MKVKEIMTPAAKAIWLTESLADAAKLMWENDCGVLPIIKDGRKVIGLITDRDICMAVAMRDTNPSGVSVEEVMTGQVYSVTPEDDVNEALNEMQEHKIRRLVVTNAEGELEGILSMNDIVLNAELSVPRCREHFPGDLPASGGPGRNFGRFDLARPGDERAEV
jgi:CBS domain-containing protein